MAIEIEEKFQVEAPIERVWEFVMDPARVASCMPGAKLEEVVDERTFEGSIRIKVGAIMASYKGRVEMTEVDEISYSVVMSAEGTETGGGTAKGTMTSLLRAVDGGKTELVATASVDLTGRIMQVGRGMIQGVSHQLFKQFVSKATKQLEAEPAAVADGSAAAAPVAAPSEGEAIAVLPLLLRTLWTAIVNFFRRLFARLFGRQPKGA